MQDQQIFEGRRALVTGSTSGIGLAIARALAARGCAIMFTGLGGDIDQHHQLAADIASDCGVKTGFLEGDIGDPAFIKTLVTETDRQLGGLNILVNNAGMQNVQPITEFPDQTWESIIGVNLSAAFYTIKSAPAFDASGRFWTDYQYCLGPGADRVDRQSGLCVVKARAGWPDQGGCA